MRKILPASLLLLGGLLSATTVLAAGPGRASSRVQCWTDRNGNRACGDSIPPEYVHQQREVFDAQGRVRQVKPREKTAAEIAAEEKAAKEAAELALKKQKQQDYDRFLLSTYNSGKEITRARDERIAMLDGREKLVEKAVEDNQKAIDQQQRRIDGLTKGGKKADASMTRKLDELKKTLAANRASLVDYKDEKQQVTDKYDADLARYLELTADSAKP